MIPVTIHIPSHAQDVVKQWLDTHHCKTVSYYMSEGMALPASHVLVEYRGSTEGIGKWRVSFTDDLREAALLFKLTYGGR